MRTLRLALVLLLAAVGAVCQTPVVIPNAVLAPVPWREFLDQNGRPLALGKVCTYQAGTTSGGTADCPDGVPLATFTDNTATVPNPNPIILNSAGRAKIWIGAGPYKWVLTTSTGAAVWSEDGIVSEAFAFLKSLQSVGDSAFITYVATGTGAVIRSVETRLQDFVLDGDYATFAQACAAATALGKTLIVSHPHAIAVDTTVPDSVNIRVDTGGLFTVALGKTLTISGSLEAGLYPIFAGPGFTVLSKSTEVYPQWWGAKGDGTTDSTFAIQSALNTQRTVHLSKGTYKILTASATGQALIWGFALYAHNNVLTGDGAAVTSLVLGDATTGSGAALISDHSLLSYFSLDCGFDPATSMANLGSCIQLGSHSTATELSVFHAKGSTLICSADEIVVHHNTFATYGDHAVYCSGTVAAPATRLFITDNYIIEDITYQNNPGTPPPKGNIKLRGDVSYATMSGNTIVGQIGILITGVTSVPDNPRVIRIFNNHITGTYSAIHLLTVLDVDNGYRMTDVEVRENTLIAIGASAYDVALGYGAAVIKNNNMTAGGGSFVANLAEVALPVSEIIGNTITCPAYTVLYKPGPKTIVRNNVFIGCGVYDVYKAIYNNNIFVNAAGTAIELRSAASATDVVEVTNNTFTGNTLGINIAAGADSYVIRDNIFQNNTASLAVVSGTIYNLNTVDRNLVASGGAWPLAGTSDGIALKVDNRPTVIPYVDGTTMLDVTACGAICYIYVANTGPTVIHELTGGAIGSVVILVFDDANTTVTRDHAVLDGGVNYVSSVNAVMVLVRGIPWWYQVNKIPMNS